MKVFLATRAEVGGTWEAGEKHCHDISYAISIVSTINRCLSLFWGNE